MTLQTSITTQKAYSLSMVCRTWEIARSSVYFVRAQQVAGAGEARPHHCTSECNGVAERFVRTLKEQLLWVHPRHITPRQARARLKPRPAQAA